MLLKKLGKYEIIEWLGGGRFGDVFLALDTILESRFAIKVARMRPEETGMLKDEARLLAALNHENIVRFYNVDIIDGRLVMVMEYIAGSTMRETIAGGTLDMTRAVGMVVQLLDAVKYAHGMGVLHRDLKPENVLLSQGDRVKIADFGLARFVVTVPPVTSTAGTPLYMAPEVWRGQYSDKSDIWSIGVVMYELFTGTPPFMDDDLEGLRHKIERRRMLAPNIVQPALPGRLTDAIEACLAVDPLARPDANALLRMVRPETGPVHATGNVTLPGMEAKDLALTPVQEEILARVNGNLLVLGQAGCGKTATLISAILRLVKTGVPAGRILACTFTNKAANEIRQRLAQVMPQIQPDLWLGTFHTLAMRILRRDAERLDINPEFTVADPMDIAERLDVSTGRYRMRGVIRHIEQLKSQGFDAVSFEPRNEWERTCHRVFRRYEEYCRANDVIDYEDLILLSVHLLDEHNDIREFYQYRFDHIFVDELQDINPHQYRLLQLMYRQRIFLTGDEDQAIYGWRGADRSIIYRASKDFPDLATLTLNQSFRLPQAIIDVANNLMRRPAQIVPSPNQGEVLVYAAESFPDEVEYLAREITQLSADGYAFNHIAILYRTHAQGKLFEEGLRDRNIPTNLIGGSLADCPETSPLLRYLALLNTPETDLGVEEFLAQATGLLNIAARDRAQARELFTHHRRNGGLLPVSRVFDDILSLVELDGERVAELLAYARDATAPSVRAFLSELRLMQELDLTNWNRDAVRLMTAHAAKGLEFPVVFIVDLVEDVFPLTRTFADEKELAEERRLCYVAVTRAQQKLYLVYPKTRLGRTQLPSRFLVDMFRKP